MRVWDAASGKQLHTLKGHTVRIWSVAFVPGGQTLASGSEDNTIRLWDAGAGKELQTLKGHSGWVQGVAFARDGKTLASASWDNTARLRDVATGKTIHVLRGHPNGVYSVSFTPDGKTLATGSVDIRLWDVAMGQALKSRPEQTAGVDWSIAFSPDGKTLAWGDSNQMMHVWDVGTAKVIRTWKCDERRVLSLAFAPDGKTLAVGGSCLRLWDPATGQEILPSGGHHGGVNAVAIVPDGKSLASGGDDQAVRRWRLDTGKEIRSWTAERSWIESVAFFAGRQVAGVRRTLPDSGSGTPRPARRFVRSRYAKRTPSAQLDGVGADRHDPGFDRQRSVDRPVGRRHRQETSLIRGRGRRGAGLLRRWPNADGGVQRRGETVVRGRRQGNRCFGAP